MKKELDERRLASTYNTQQLNDVQHKLRNIESKANQLHAQNIQLSVKLEDFKAKYEGELRVLHDVELNSSSNQFY